MKSFWFLVSGFKFLVAEPVEALVSGFKFLVAEPVEALVSGFKFDDAIMR